MENKCSDQHHPALAAVCSSFRLLSAMPDALLPALLCSALPALLDGWVGGAYPFLEKPKYHFLPPKIPAIFPKTSPPTNHI